MSISVTSTTQENTVTISVVGEVDVSNADELRDAITTSLDAEAEALNIDLAEVSYIDSTGIGVLVGAAHRAKEVNRGFAVVNPQRNVLRVLEMLAVVDDLGIKA